MSTRYLIHENTEQTAWNIIEENNGLRKYAPIVVVVPFNKDREDAKALAGHIVSCMRQLQMWI